MLSGKAVSDDEKTISDMQGPRGQPGLPGEPVTISIVLL